MNQITHTGKTTEEAISEAITKLGVTRDRVTINVLTEEKKGFLGFGSRLAEVEVTVKEVQLEEIDVTIHDQPDEQQPVVRETIPEEFVLEVNESTRTKAIEETKKYLQDIAKQMKIDDLEIETIHEGKYVTLRLESKKAALLIGKRGQTLNALQQLSQLVVNKFSNQFLMVHLDVENYRERRKESLEQLADRMADKAIRSGKKVEFEPMPSYERKVIHHALSRRLDIETFSVGTDPNRYLVIEPLK